MQPVTLKPGITTSEFLGVIVSMFVAGLVLFKVLPAEQAVTFSDQLLQFLNLVIQIATLAAAAYMTVRPLITYIQGRVTLKQQLLTAQKSA